MDQITADLAQLVPRERLLTALGGFLTEVEVDAIMRLCYVHVGVLTAEVASLEDRLDAITRSGCQLAVDLVRIVRTLDGSLLPPTTTDSEAAP